MLHYLYISLQRGVCGRVGRKPQPRTVFYDGVGVDKHVEAGAVSVVDAQLVTADEKNAVCTVLYIGASAAWAEVHSAIGQVLQTRRAHRTTHRHCAVGAVLQVDLIADVSLHLSCDIDMWIVCSVFDAY